MRKLKNVVKIGSVKIGEKHPIAVQSMTKTKTCDIKKTISQIRRLQRAGCEIVRVAVVNKSDATVLRHIKSRVSIPVIADIHFDYRLALQSIDAGVDKIRINPGNIGEKWKVVEVIKKSKDHNIPIRIGVNAGSLPKSILKKYQHPTPEAIVLTVKKTLEIFIKNDYDNLVISAKGADVNDTIISYKALHRQFDFPLHVGITEAGLPFRGGIKSGVGMGIILHEGIGNTIRVSLTGDPVLEITAAYEILNALGLRQHGPVLISCPICGRCDVKLEKIARIVEQRLKKYCNFMKIAVMGCVVNGPGEARESDFGIACGKERGIVFAKGKPIKRVKETKLVDTLFEVIDENITDR
jgi:(E)-4-hydroxy-3-methylbut-2-enyl-diphosphate synthase